MNQPVKTRLNILFISNEAVAINEVRDFLKVSENLDYHVEHRQDFFGSADLLSAEGHMDVIFLDVEGFASGIPHTTFQRMLSMADGIPIIVFADAQYHHMIDSMIADGAADGIFHGDFGADAFKFRDVLTPSVPSADKAHSSMVEILQNRVDPVVVEAVKNIHSALTNVTPLKAVTFSRLKSPT